MRTQFSCGITVKRRSPFIIFISYNGIMFSRIDFAPIQFHYLMCARRKRSLKNSGAKSNGVQRIFPWGVIILNSCHNREENKRHLNGTTTILLAPIILLTHQNKKKVGNFNFSRNGFVFSRSYVMATCIPMD